MMITPSASVAGYRITETLGLVRGNTIRARHVGKDILAGFRNIVGYQENRQIIPAANSVQQFVKAEAGFRVQCSKGFIHE